MNHVPFFYLFIYLLCHCMYTFGAILNNTGCKHVRHQGETAEALRQSRQQAYILNIAMCCVKHELKKIIVHTQS